MPAPACTARWCASRWRAAERRRFAGDGRKKQGGDDGHDDKAAGKAAAYHLGGVDKAGGHTALPHHLTGKGEQGHRHEGERVEALHHGLDKGLIADGRTQADGGQGRHTDADADGQGEHQKHDQ